MWKTLKHIVNTDCNVKTSYDKIQFEKIATPNDFAENFNLFCIDSINDIVDSIPKSDMDPLQFLPQDITHQLTSFNDITKQDLRNIVNNFKHKSSSCDGLNLEMLKNILNEVEDNLVLLINLSLETGMVPKSWKKSYIVPIPKVPNPKEPKDLRPINMVPIYEKILETWVQVQLYTYFENHNLLYPCQFGFRKQKSTEEALQLLLSTWRESLNDNKFIIGMFLDFQRAFETINRGVLIEKLKKYGVTGKALKWLENYIFKQELKL